MMLIVVSFALLAAAVDAQTACTNHPTGFCANIFTSSCPQGTYMSFSGCGFLEMCCYPDESTASPVATTAASSSGPTCGITDYLGNKIVGGTATVIQKYPWQVSVQLNGYHICGGSIINDRWIVTAAHCIKEWDFTVYVDDFTIVAGSTYQDNYNTYYNLYQVDEVLTHTGYVLNERNDIALIKTSRAIDLSGTTKKAICLPNSGESHSGEVCVVTGWGAVQEEDANGNQVPIESHLREVSIPIIAHNVCEYYMGSLHSTMICAGQRAGGKDSCQGDSGGPLACQDSNGIWKLAGVVSYGYGCAREDLFGAYTDVSKFHDWIIATMAQYP